MLRKKEKRNIRHKRVRAKVFGTKDVPRLCVFRSNNHIYAQLIDDDKGNTLASADDMELNVKEGKIEKAKQVGNKIAKASLKLKIKKVVFDRGGYRYHGRIKALAEGAREGGLNF